MDWKKLAEELKKELPEASQKYVDVSIMYMCLEEGRANVKDVYRPDP